MVLGFSCLAAAVPDKSNYSLSNPTPAGLMRELTTDRPDVTEGPITVDAGHMQLEMDLANYTTDVSSGVRSKAWGVVPFNLRLGLTNNMELGLFVSPYIRDTQRAGRGISETRQGFGDITLRGKFNFWGNDDGSTALGLITDLKLPTAAEGLGNGAVEGAVLLPLSVDLGVGWDLGAMTGLDFARSEAGSRKSGWINSVTLGHDLTKILAGYVEFASETGISAPITTFDTGLTLKLGANTQIDIGAQFGLSRAANDAVVFTGLTRRY
ncbi:MAG: transporter [Opitutaceae bacterium]